MSDPARSMPHGKHRELIVREVEPFNGGAPPELLGSSFVTPTELFFVRNHAAVPQVDMVKYSLRLNGFVKNSCALSLDQIRNEFPRHTVAATLQCAGNRREDMMRVKEIEGEVAWGTEAISNASWSGARLSDVLAHAGVEANDARHVWFTGLDEVERKGRRFGFGGSIPIEKALSAEVLLAYQMNDEPLAPVHGAPLRAVVPGYIGARSVKWLSEIRLEKHPSDNYFQAHAYKLFPPGATAQTADWERGLMLGELSLNSVVCRPQEGETVRAGKCTVEGYAMAGGGRSVERVDVSCDEGATWTTANLKEAGEAETWTWRLWQAELALAPGKQTIIARAWDSAANTQPEQAEKIWNFKGYMNNAWHRVNITAQ